MALGNLNRSRSVWFTLIQSWAALCIGAGANRFGLSEASLNQLDLVADSWHQSEPDWPTLNTSSLFWLTWFPALVLGLWVEILLDCLLMRLWLGPLWGRECK